MGFLNLDGKIYTSARDDGNGDPITDVHVRNEIRAKALTLEEQLTELNVVDDTLTFSKDIYFVEIYNTDEINDGLFNVNGIDIVVPAGKILGVTKIGGTPSPTVVVVNSVSYIVTRYE